RPEQAILGLRKGLALFANLRPVKVFPQLAGSSPVKRELVEGVDMMVVRELTGGLYFGKPKKRWENGRGRRAVDTMSYSEREVERVLRVGFELAQGRRKKLASVDKANILETSRLWREIAMELSAEYPDVTVEHVLVDTASMRLVRQPASFDVMVTENTFGDILTDEASVLAGSMGMLPSASLGNRKRRAGGVLRTFGLYEPIHGSAPDIAGQNKANPLAMFLSVAMMLRLSCGLAKEADAIEAAVERVLAEGYRTGDVATAGSKLVNTTQMGALVIERVGN
ncbi:MAG: 3-isopropylmalate dehydrogenase, partial [Chloroflexi bacterium]|nr:3-isopropylmalate dehydrogenase [Chloroflexota bacterium]